MWILCKIITLLVHVACWGRAKVVTCDLFKRTPITINLTTRFTIEKFENIIFKKGLSSVITLQCSLIVIFHLTARKKNTCAYIVIFQSLTHLITGAECDLSIGTSCVRRKQRNNTSWTIVSPNTNAFEVFEFELGFTVLRTSSLLFLYTYIPGTDSKQKSGGSLYI